MHIRIHVYIHFFVFCFAVRLSQLFSAEKHFKQRGNRPRAQKQWLRVMCGVASHIVVGRGCARQPSTAHGDNL